MNTRTAQEIARFGRQAVRDVEAGLRESSDEVLAHIRSRTARGISMQGRRFAPYRPSTAKRKGRTQPVTLRDSTVRSMLDTLAAQRRRRLLFEIRFTSRDKERIARYHQFGTRRMARRAFFGVTLQFARRNFQRLSSRLEQSAPRDRRKRFTIQVSV